MGSRATDQEITFEALEERELALGREFWEENPNLALRVHRAVRWGMRGDSAIGEDDFDAAFVFYWIAFNAAYAEESEENTEQRAREKIVRYLLKTVRIDPLPHDIRCALGRLLGTRACALAESVPVRAVLETSQRHSEQTGTGLSSSARNSGK